MLLLKQAIPQQIANVLVIDEHSPSGLRYIKSGKPAGTKRKSGSWQIFYKKKHYLAHRVIWFLHSGNDPLEQEIDHIDRNPSNNRLDNLRLATRGQNCTNKITSSASGYRGVYKHHTYNRWQARIKGKSLGYFSTKEEAALVFDKAAKELYEGFASLNQATIKSLT